MHLLTISGYKFISLSDIETLREFFFIHCDLLRLKGTILLSHEGININLSGNVDDLTVFQHHLQKDNRFADILFRKSYSLTQPFKRLKIKLKKEIISFRQSEINVEQFKAPSISPEIFKCWLDEQRDMNVLDTRNEYEIKFGTFKNAMNLSLKHFTDFPSSIDHLEREKTTVVFCTGGIRCEKAALYMLENGFREVYQLEGGILNYFSRVGMAHYEGECFVFDERISVDAYYCHSKERSKALPT